MGLPKTITEHPGMLECDWGADTGCDYKYDTILKAGWVYEHGRMSGGRCGNFNTVADFKHANPIRREDYVAKYGEPW